MSERIAPDAGHDPLSAAVEALAAQAVVLNRMFCRAAKEALSGSLGSHRALRKALKAQARCRTTVKILLALRRAARGAEKFSNSNEQTIENGKSPA